MVVLLWLTFFAVGMTLVVSILMAANKPILINYLIVGLTCCGFLVAFFQTAIQYSNLLLSMFNVGVVGVGMYRLRIVMRKRA